jgi:hypothetical protein
VLLIALVARVRPWRHLAAVVAGIIAFGLAARAIVGAISARAVAGAGQRRLDRHALKHFVIVPVRIAADLRQRPLRRAICALVVVVQLKGVGV